MGLNSVLWICIVILPPNFIAGNSHKHISEADATKYLDQYGYVGKSSASSPSMLVTKGTVLRNFQRWAGLRVTGHLDEATESKMVEPRCGVADVHQIIEGPAPKWPNKWITYSIVGYSKRFPAAETRRLTAEAFQYWAAVSDLEFVEVQSNPNIKIKFVTRAHQDNNPFDGPGKVLAHAFPPEFGGIHFDDEEIWADFSVGIRTGEIDFLTVAIHEIGHALGVAHIRESASIMHPWYAVPKDEKNNYVAPKLNHDDIQAMTDLYGAKSEAEDEGKRSESEEDASDAEKFPWDVIAIAAHANGQDTLIFDGQGVHRVVRGTVGHTKDLSSHKFATSPRLKAAVYDMWIDKVLLFAEEGQHIFVYGIDYGQFIGARPLVLRIRRNLPQRPPFAIHGALSSVTGQIWLIGNDGHYAELDPESFTILQTGRVRHMPDGVKGGHKDYDGSWRLYTEHEKLHLDSNGGRIRDNSPTIVDPRKSGKLRSRLRYESEGGDDRPMMKLRPNSVANLNCIITVLIVIVFWSR